MSAVATILGLLLVVTFIANYLSTTLPRDMSVNDINHDLLVENEVGTTAALMAAVSAKDEAGVELSQPIVLGSEGLPPFAPPDSGAIAQPASGSWESVSFALTGTTGGAVEVSSSLGGFVVALQNTYAPSAQVAFDYGAVVLAQPAGTAQMVDPPPISIDDKALTVWVPVFTSSFASEGGTGTAILAFQLLSLSSQTFPSGGLSLSSNGVTVTIKTPYSSAWMAYLGTAASGFHGDATCTPASSSECSTSGTFRSNGPLGTVTLSLPSADVTSVTLEIATFSVSDS